MTRREQAYERKIKELIGRVGKLEDREVAKVFKLLETAQKDVAAKVAVTEWDAHRIPQLNESIENALETFRQAYQADHAEASLNMWNAGIDMIDSPLQTAGIQIMATGIDRTTLEILQGMGGELINGLAMDAKKKIKNEIAMGIMGQKTPFEVMEAVGKNLTDKGTFKSVFHRAEAITRTELAGINSAAREARMQKVLGYTDPDMNWVKKWIKSGKRNPRENHAKVDGHTAEIGKEFDNGILYPHEPGLPAKERVN